MKYLGEFMNQYGVSIIHSIAISILSYISITIKKIYHKYIQDKTKKEVVKMVCSAINQLYPSDSGQDKLNKAIENSKAILNEKGINISDLELRIYIESTVNYFKNFKLKYINGMI